MLCLNLSSYSPNGDPGIFSLFFVLPVGAIFSQQSHIDCLYEMKI